MSASRPALSNAQIDALIGFRRTLHRHPELSGHEADTARRVADFLAPYAPDMMIKGLGGHGIAAVWTGAAPGPTVMLRCELDGLPIAERPGPDHVSQVPGHGHLCGHDGHMAILGAVAMGLHARPPAKGRAVLLFQPAEETGAGARAVLADPAFASIAPDYAFALHNIPGIPLGAVQIKPGQFNCASRGMRIAFSGKTAHASQPETGVSPARAIADFILGAQRFNAGQLGDEDFTLTTIVHARFGEPAFGVAPGEGGVLVTLRTATDSAMERLVAAATSLAHTLAKRDGLGVEIAFADIFAACTNHPEATEIALAAMQDAGHDPQVLDLPFRWSEDFGAFAATARSAMFVIGAGQKHPALHNPDYDFPDALIAPAAGIFSAILQRLLGGA